jgi:glycosyltransferase involved in cell wall biosynthesis
MRIRYVLANAYAVGGTVRTVVNQANALCADHDVEIASVYRHRALPTFPIDPRVRLVPLADQRTARRRLMYRMRVLPNPLPHKLDYKFRRWDPGVDLRLLWYLWTADDGILVTTRPGLNLLSARMAPRRLIRVAQDHRSLGSYKPALRDALVQAYRTFDAVTVLTKTDHAAYRQALGPDTRLECIPNGVPWPQPPAALERKVLVAAGRLQPSKGFDLLLDAFQRVAAKHPDWQLWIFGSGKLRGRLAARIERLGLTGRAHLKGTAERLDQQFAEASAYVLSSRHEGLPMVVLEAMGAGLPVVSFDCPSGPAEIITHGRNGLLVPPRDVNALAAGICELIEDPARRRAMGAAALQDSERYSIGHVRRRWEELFSELTTARSGAVPAMSGFSTRP